MGKRIIIIGAGFSGLSAAAVLAREGHEVLVFDKHSMPGGRARMLEEAGFRFDMGPTWYWMPDVFERYFSLFGKKPSDYYELQRLDPSYRIFYSRNEKLDVSAVLGELEQVFEQVEPGSAFKLRAFLRDAAYKYRLGIQKLVYKPSLSLNEFIEPWLIRGFLRGDFLRSVSYKVRKYFKDERLIRLLEFPVLFLGATAKKIPALYTLMNYADLVMGTWYVKGGMHSVAEGMYRLALEQGVRFRFETTVGEIRVKNGKALGVAVADQFYEADAVLGTGDYHFIETNLLARKYRSYTDRYWEHRKLAPSALLFYLGLDKKLNGLQHHNLFFDTDFDAHSRDIYDKPGWPREPAIYVSCSSITDATVAPEGSENVIILIPVAPGMEDTEEIREHYLNYAVHKLERFTGDRIEPHIVFKRSYAQSDFVRDYGAFKGNAYGLANTLFQTAILKPSLRSKKVKNLFYAGQLTVPGPGVPPTIISGQVVSREMTRYLKSDRS